MFSTQPIAEPADRQRECLGDAETFFLLPEKGRTQRPFSLLLAVLLIAAAACDPDVTRTSEEHPSLVTRVDHVVDGDTVWVDDLDESVRLIGINTPEVYPEVECYGDEATSRLIDLIPHGTEIEVVFDAEEHDQYGRYLGYVYRASDRLFVNMALVEGGYAEMVRIEPNVRFAKDLEAAEAEAKEQGLGLWSAC